MKNINLKDIDIGKKTFDKSVVGEFNRNKMVKKNDIAIIGMSVKVGSAENLDQFWDIMMNGYVDLNYPDEQRKKDFYEFMVSEGFSSQKNNVKFNRFTCMKDVDKFDYDFFKINPGEAKLMDPIQRMFLQTSYNALEDAGYGAGNIRGRKIGVFLGDSVADINYNSIFAKETEYDSGKVFTGNMLSIIPSRISYLMDLTGPSVYIDTGCSSTLTALHQAILSLQSGDSEMAVVGGVRYNYALPVSNFGRMEIFSADGRTRAFDDNSDGTNNGEASCAIVIKQLSKAIEDNDSIYAVIKGTAINNDGASIGITAPNMDAQIRMITDAWHKAGVDPETVSYIECHGTGTKIGDPIEMNAIIKAFEKYTDKKQFCAVGSCKSNFSHTGQVSGLVGIIKTVLALRNRVIPPTINFDVPNSNVDFIDSPIYVNNTLRKMEGGTLRFGVNSFSMNGTNVHVILEEYEIPMRKYDEDSYKLLCLSASKQESLLQLVKDHINFIKKRAEISLSDYTYTVNTSRKNCEYRLAVVFSTREELLEALESRLSELGNIKPINIKNNKTQTDPLIDSYISNEKSDRDKLNQLACLYCDGYDINLCKLYDKSRYNRVNVPVYPFAKDRCWYEFSGKQQHHMIFERYCRDLLGDRDLPGTLRGQLEKLTECFSNYVDTMQEKDAFTSLELKGRDNGDYSEIESFIAQKCYETFGYNVINIDDNFSSFNADSLQMTTFFGKIRAKYNVSLSDLYENNTIRSLANCLSENEDDIYTRVELLIEESKSAGQTEPLENYYCTEIETYKKRISDFPYIDINRKKMYSNILLTGATGYLGIYLLKELLENTSSRITMIARAGNDEEALLRIRNNFAHYFDAELFDRYSDRMDVYSGDLSEHSFGLGDRYTELANKIDCILNSAANSSHFGSYSSFYNGNVVSTENIIMFAEEGIKKTINHISTYAVAQFNGSGKGAYVTEFDNVNADNAEKVNGYYPRTKIIAENLLNNSRESGIDVRIFRVDDILFEYDRGIMQKNIEKNAISLVIRSFIELGMIPDINGFSYEFTYVDYAAKAIVMLMGLSDVSTDNFHISNTVSEELKNYLADSNLDKHAELVSVEDFLRNGLKLYESNDPKYDLFNELVIHGFDGGKLEDGYVSSLIGFDFTNKLLEKMGFKWPKLTVETFNRFIRHCISIGFIY